jgi:hypothetical protein
VFLVLFLVAAVALYWTPTYLAWELGCTHIGHIALVNFLLGWTVIGWVVAVVMAWHDRPIPSGMFDTLSRSLSHAFTPKDQ